jgi:hypothetical protein
LNSLPFDTERAKIEALEMNPKLKVFLTSSVKDLGIDLLIDSFIDSLKRLRKNHA